MSMIEHPSLQMDYCKDEEDDLLPSREPSSFQDCCFPADVQPGSLLVNTTLNVGEGVNGQFFEELGERIEGDFKSTRTK